MTQTKPTRARTESARDQRRSDLLEAALEEFFEKGFAAARIDDIASRAGVSKGTVYLYFESKEDLFKSLIETHAYPKVENLSAIAQANDSFFDLIEAVFKMARHFIDEGKLPKMLKVMSADGQNFPSLIDHYRTQVIERMLGIMSSVLIAAEARGEIEIEDPHLTARLIIAPVILSSFWRVIFEADESRERIDIDALLSIHLSYLKKALATT